jgi:DNA polymerase V
MRRIYRAGVRDSQSGVMLAELRPEGDGQGDLFAAGEGDRSRRLMSALDAINRRMGRDTVF